MSDRPRYPIETPLGDQPLLVKLAQWLSKPCPFPRWAIIWFSFTYGLLFVATILSLFD